MRENEEKNDNKRRKKKESGEVPLYQVCGRKDR